MQQRHRTSVDELLDVITRTAVMWILRCLNWIVNLWKNLKDHTRRIYTAIRDEYKDELYIFYGSNTFPYVTKTGLEHPQEGYEPTWVYNPKTHSFRGRSANMEDSIEKRFPWISVELVDKEKGDSQCLIGFWTGLKWSHSAVPPPLEVLLHTWAVTEKMSICFDGLELHVRTREGENKVYTMKDTIVF